MKEYTVEQMTLKTAKQFLRMGLDMWLDVWAPHELCYPLECGGDMIVVAGMPGWLEVDVVQPNHACVMVTWEGNFVDYELMF